MLTYRFWLGNWKVLGIAHPTPLGETELLMMNSVELFAGVGGLGIGLSNAGFCHLVALDQDKNACATIDENQRRGLNSVKNFPDEYFFPHSWTETMRQLGNAVPVALAEIMAASIREQLVRVGRTFAAKLSVGNYPIDLNILSAKIFQHCQAFKEKLGDNLY